MSVLEIVFQALGSVVGYCKCWPKKPQKTKKHNFEQRFFYLFVFPTLVLRSDEKCWSCNIWLTFFSASKTFEDLMYLNFTVILTHLVARISLNLLPSLLPLSSCVQVSPRSKWHISSLFSIIFIYTSWYFFRAFCYPNS